MSSVVMFHTAHTAQINKSFRRFLRCVFGALSLFYSKQQKEVKRRRSSKYVNKNSIFPWTVRRVHVKPAQSFARWIVDTAGLQPQKERERERADGARVHTHTPIHSWAKANEMQRTRKTNMKMKSYKNCDKMMVANVLENFYRCWDWTQQSRFTSHYPIQTINVWVCVCVCEQCYRTMNDPACVTHKNTHTCRCVVGVERRQRQHGQWVCVCVWTLVREWKWSRMRKSYNLAMDCDFPVAPFCLPLIHKLARGRDGEGATVEKRRNSEIECERIRKQDGGVGEKSIRCDNRNRTTRK